MGDQRLIGRALSFCHGNFRPRGSERRLERIDVVGQVVGGDLHGPIESWKQGLVI